ncbi:acylneuraminate cytidylyltransferase family protein [Schlesneria paludicola]|uniref:acylneuraminate cytidylyltransferase family protein n=1 Tax=Schlesneria paludicola TaxID=360056 RepID=UPI00049253F7|nr:acylneuraminate cytidylyltransferase family protein [Schlesneria paludicola]
MSGLVALLPMKAHSARVSGKNFRSFAGKPLFRWILDSLLEVTAIDRVVINTDARDILASHGLVDSDRVLIRDRKSEICGDFVSMNLVLKDDVENVPADAYLMTHTTNPLLSATTIRSAIEKYQAGVAARECDSLFSVNRFQTRFYRADGSPINHDPKNLIRTQDLEPWFEENSNLYLFSRPSFEKTQARIGEKPLLFPTPPCESADIDDQDGWDLAERLARTIPSVKC